MVREEEGRRNRNGKKGGEGETKGNTEWRRGRGKREKEGDEIEIWKEKEKG